MSAELYHHGVKGQKWGVRTKSSFKTSKRKTHESTNLKSIKKSLIRKLDALDDINYIDEETSSRNSQAQNSLRKSTASVNKTVDPEMKKRQKAALDVLMNGDKDWMGRSIHSDDNVTEMQNRGEAVLERLMYSEEEIKNKKFFGSYHPFD